MARGVYSDINVKHVQNPVSETSLKCFFSLQDKLLLLLDHLQALDMPPVTVALTRHICFLSRFTRSFFFSFSPTASETLGDRSSGQKSRRSPLQTLYDGDQVSALSLQLPHPPPSLQAVCHAKSYQNSPTLVDLNNYIFKRGDFHILSTQYLPVSGEQNSNVPVIRG